jgi:osmotically-inducible protein OsmY
MTQTHVRNDAQLKQAIVDELEWTPEVDAAHVGVAVTDGAVTLSGEVATYPEKNHAEQAAKRVRGVRAVADEITVRSTWAVANDTDIAREAGEALDRAVDVPPGAVTASVHNHQITLTGTVTWQFQRRAAARAVKYLRGVTAVHDQVELRPSSVEKDIKRSISSALVRNAQIDSNHIEVTTGDDGVIILEGSVQSNAESRQAEDAAWAAPGVSSVENLIRVES